MVHKGEIIQAVVKEKGVSVTHLAEEMGVSRGTLYNIFERMEVDTDTILKIGAIIHYDFSEKFPKLKTNKVEEPVEEYSSTTINKLKEEIDYWRAKYIALLEEHNKMLKK
ncbi:MAG: helix-turn-helix domain-containing protein [Cytophagaceae bacterium]|jgi:transcriptional regulator with XRE-family HTH domain|nr:helix-turn-helix domain-containing protein [Cytophagaceae bacterium]